MRFLCLLFTLIALPAQAQQLGTFDVFGIKIGDTPVEADAALKAKDFTEFQRIMGPSFEQIVQMRRKKLKYGEGKDAVAETVYTRGGDRVSVMFLAWPDGERVKKVSYTPGITDDDCPGFLAAAEEKYSWAVEWGGFLIDRPVVKKGISERMAPGSITINMKCGGFSRFLSLNSRYGDEEQRVLLDKADGEVKHDF